MKKIIKNKFLALALIIFIVFSSSNIIIVNSSTIIESGKENILYPSIEKQIISNNLLDIKISLIMKFAKFPSISACIINKDESTWFKSYGYYDLRNQKEPNSDTIYLIASITKTIVGTALMQLYEKGFFKLDEDVNNYLPFKLRNPNFPDKQITFRMLLSHTSSLNTNTRNEYYWMNFSGDPPFNFFPEPYLEEFLIPGGKYYHQDVWSEIYKPGEKAMYANIGFDLISYLVEIISKESFLTYCQKNIFDPLEMHNTSFNLSTLQIENVAIPYHYHLGEYYQINELSFLLGNYVPEQPYWKIRCYPAGGLYTTVNDLSHFLIAHMNNGIYKNIKILEKETVELMHKIQPDNSIKYGLAWMEYPITNKNYATGHGGDIMGVDTWMLYIPSEEIGIIYLANGNPAYSQNPTIGYLSVQLLLYYLFKEGGLKYYNN